MQLTRFQRMRIMVLIAVAIAGFLGYHLWYYRTVDVLGVPVITRMQRPGFSGKTVAILPMGKVDVSEIRCLASLFQELYQMEVEFLDRVDIPKDTFIPRQHQYDGVDINKYLVGKRGRYFRLLGIIDEDLSAGPYNFVFGVASLTNGVATISVARLKETFYGRPKDDLLFRSRLFKIVLHEYGHTFALGHCEESGCLMEFINHIGDLDSSPCGFCWVCNQRIIPEL